MSSTQSVYTYNFPMTSVATDIVVLHITYKGDLQVALVKRNESSDAHAGEWALPGGFFKPDSDLDIESCARRELSEETSIALVQDNPSGPYMELVGVYSAKGRDPRPERVISIAYLAVLTQKQASLGPAAKTDVSEARWFPIEAVDTLELAFDHKQIIADARKRLAESMTFARKDDAHPELLFAFLPEKFTLSDAQGVMQALKGEPVDKSNFRKYIDKYVVATGDYLPRKTRPAALFQRRNNDPAQDDRLLPKGLARLRSIGEQYDILNFEHLLSSMTSAPEDAVKMVGRILSTYGRHRDYVLKATRVPDLRIDDAQTGRVLVTLKWQPQKSKFLCTALVETYELHDIKLEDLRRWTTGPHKSAFRLGTAEEDFEQLDMVASRSAALLVVH